MTGYHSYDTIPPLIGGDVRRTEGVEYEATNLTIARELN